MLLWIVLVFGWVGILLLAVAVFWIAGYVEKKVRRISVRTRRREDEHAWPV